MSMRDVAGVIYDCFRDEPIKREKTRFKDKDKQPIYIGDWIHVQEYADDDERSFGAYDYEGRVEWEEYSGKKYVSVVYYDIGQREGSPLICFPKKFRHILTEKEIEEI